MSCGNRFSCGIKRYQQPSFAPDRPSNPELHQENQNRLSELLRLREQQDQSFSYPSASASTDSTTSTTSTSTQSNPLPSNSAVYYPWVQSSTN